MYLFNWQLLASLPFRLRLPDGSSLGALSGKMILETGDSLKGLASADSDLVVTVSLLEMS